MIESIRSSLGARGAGLKTAPDFVPAPISAIESISQPPWDRPATALLLYSHTVIMSFEETEPSGLICWHFVSEGWNWNLPNHLLVFLVKVILVHMKPQAGFCLGPVAFPILSS